MCGIVGGLTAAAPPCVAEARIDAAVASLVHRGPDDAGRLVSRCGRAFLGHRRLSLIDLAGGRQPIVDEEGLCHLCYNGEIYNFRPLREALLQRGHRFRTRTDGEAALHLYQERPDTFLDELSGMFALAILDERGPRLTLARDRNGIKPLYYHFDGRRIIFGSELKAVLACLEERPPVSAPALRAFLRWKYIPAPLTAYENIYKLPPGHWLRASPEAATGRLSLETRPYWSPDFSGEKISSEAEALEQLDVLLRDTVRSHLESDVDVGALLSGGVDSSLVTALAATLSSRRIKTFSVGFQEAGFDQLPYARAVAERYGTEHHEELVSLDPLAALQRLTPHFDEPFADSSALACNRLCEVAARHVKTVLTGDGGDESFAGYRRYEDVLQAEGRADRSWRRLANRMGVAGMGLTFSPEAKFLKRARIAACPAGSRHQERQALCSPWLMRRLLGPALWEDRGDRDLFEPHYEYARSRGWRPVETAQYVDLRTYLPEDILTKVDRTSMAHSLECRVPLLDHAVTEFSARLDIDLKIRGGVRKYLLKRLAERYVPHELLYRPKMGFRVPIRRWFKRDLLDRAAEFLLDGSAVGQGFLDRRGVQWMLRQQRRPWIDLASQFWALLCLEQWARTCLR